MEIFLSASGIAYEFYERNRVLNKVPYQGFKHWCWGPLDETGVQVGDKEYVQKQERCEK